MKSFLIVTGLLLLPHLATAQVVVNPAALAQLAGIAAPAMSAPAAAAPVRMRHVVHHRPIIQAIAKPLAMAPVPVVARPAPPPQAKPALAPILQTKPAVLPPAPKPAPRPTQVVLKFAAGSADLPAGAGASLAPYCKAQGIIAINARAPGDASDPSIAMRLSMARAFAIRDALTACGVPSQNILPRALGTVPGQNEDEAVLGVAP